MLNTEKTAWHRPSSSSSSFISPFSPLLFLHFSFLPPLHTPATVHYQYTPASRNTPTDLENLVYYGKYGGAPSRAGSARPDDVTGYGVHGHGFPGWWLVTSRDSKNTIGNQFQNRKF
ncbi:hypothetical protein E2C01_020719 [Portunus trituberculatus]|uniref:Uncharacterized protein n=1 Tax=Portunus trituberculatus TaxID=210409 RepID=A0A5B7E331_PORTR|nr:hypothetical protein [Portunus trituberculatus]